MVTVISSELAIASVDSRLVAAVTRNIAKAVALFCVKCEGCVDSEARQVIGQPSPAQLTSPCHGDTFEVWMESDKKNQ